MRRAGHITLLSSPHPSNQTGCQEETDSLAELDTWKLSNVNISHLLTFKPAVKAEQLQTIQNMKQATEC